MPGLRLVALLLILFLVPFGSAASESSACGPITVRPFEQSDVQIGMIVDGGATQHDASIGHCSDGWLASDLRQLVPEIETSLFAPTETIVMLGELLPPEIGPPRS